MKKHLTKILQLFAIILLASCGSELPSSVGEIEVHKDVIPVVVSPKRSIHLSVAGTLQDSIKDSEKYLIEELTLSGEINASDLRLIRDMAGSDYDLKSTAGKLKKLDLKDVSILKSRGEIMDIYLQDGYSGANRVTQSNVIPKSLFKKCRIISIILPKDTYEIKAEAFYSCNSLTSIIIPSSVTKIGDEAFSGCIALSSLDIPDAVTSIGNGAFSGCKEMTSLSIPTSMTIIGTGAFSGCTGLLSITIPNSVTSIGYRAFSYCSNLTSIIIPNSVTSIMGEAFEGCSSLTSIKVESGNPVYDSRDNCNAIIETKTNKLIMGFNNTIIPSSIKTIGKKAFVWGGGSVLSTLKYPNSLTTIEDSAFYGCHDLISLEIPQGLTSICRYAFGSCKQLSSVTIPNSVSSISNAAFRYSKAIQTITVDEGNKVYDSRNNSNAIINTSNNTLVIGTRNTIIPNSITSIGYAAFYSCDGLKSITIPQNVTSLGEYAFHCEDLISVVSNIQKPFDISSNVFYGINKNAILTVPKGTKHAYESKTGWKDNFKEIVESTE